MRFSDNCQHYSKFTNLRMKQVGGCYMKRLKEQVHNKHPMGETTKKGLYIGFALIVLVVLSAVPLPERWRILERATLDISGQRAIAVLSLP